jgi:imidazolonepropionase-like amidohydrolase
VSEENVNLIVQAKMLIDGTGAEPVSRGLVAVAGRRIVYAGPAAAAPAFPGARVIELPEATLLPGLIDMHVHPTYYWAESDLAPYTLDSYHALSYSQVDIALLAVANLRSALMAGVTTARDTATVDNIMFDVRRAIRKGRILGPKVYVAGRLVTATAGHCHYHPGLSNQADGPYDFRRAVREEVRAGADFVKIANNGAELTQEELNAAVDEAHRLGKKVVCHTIGAPAERMAIDAGVDTFEHGTPTEEELDLALEKGILWDPTLHMWEDKLIRKERRRRHPDPLIARQAEKEYPGTVASMERLRESMTYAVKIGLRLGAGTDSFSKDIPFDSLADEIRRLVEYGCSPMQALQAATAWPAEAMGWEEIGTLEAGKLADLIAVAGDPLVDIQAVKQVPLVILEGEVVKNEFGSAAAPAT